MASHEAEVYALVMWPMGTAPRIVRGRAFVNIAATHGQQRRTALARATPSARWIVCRILVGSKGLTRPSASIVRVMPIGRAQRNAVLVDERRREAIVSSRTGVCVVNTL